MNDRTVVVMPTYNERENLSAMVKRIEASVPQADILVVDDNSPDGTGLLADRLASADPRVHVVHRKVKAGLGAAYIEGFEWAIARGFGVIVECDADGSHQPEELPRLLAALDDHDMVIGSRWVKGGVVIDWPVPRMVLSRGGSAYARAVLSLRQRDVTGGYRAFRSDALAAIDLARVTSQGYSFQIEMLWRASRAGLRIAEVPITFTERQFGVSKMRGMIVLEAMVRVTAWGLGALLDRRHRQVPASTLIRS
jgi:glycosyltransferase involved in cell wall biosynthesis